MASQRSSDSELSAVGNAVLAVVLLVIGIGLWLYFIKVLPTLPPSAQQSIYEPIRIVLSLVAGLILFGVMKSGARIKVRGWQVVGPAAGAVVYLLIGKQQPAQDEPLYNLTVRAQDPQGAPISRGDILIEYSDVRRSEPLGANGEANFKAIPRALRGRGVRFLPRVEHYIQQWIALTLPANESAITLILQPSFAAPSPQNKAKSQPQAPHTLSNSSDGDVTSKTETNREKELRANGRSRSKPGSQYETTLRQGASELWERGACKDAVPLLLRLSNLEPGDAEVFYRLGSCEGRIGARKAAREHLVHAEKLGKGPFVARVAVELGKVSLEDTADGVPDATLQMNRALQAEPGFSPAMFLRGEILLKEGNYTAAIDAFGDLFERFDTSSDQQRANKLEACVKLAEALDRNGALDTAKLQRTRCAPLR